MKKTMIFILTLIIIFVIGTIIAITLDHFGLNPLPSTILPK
ncbi:MAG: hypothetical protein ACRCRZ_03075 [Metamycoplasmataceae bacterium]